MLATVVTSNRNKLYSYSYGYHQNTSYLASYHIHAVIRVASYVESFHDLLILLDSVTLAYAKLASEGIYERL